MWGCVGERGCVGEGGGGCACCSGGVELDGSDECALSLCRHHASLLTFTAALEKREREREGEKEGGRERERGRGRHPPQNEWLGGEERGGGGCGGGGGCLCLCCVGWGWGCVCACVGVS